MDVLIRYLHTDSNGTRLSWVQDVADAVPSYPPRYAFSAVADQAEATRFPEEEAQRLLATYAGRTWVAAELVPAGEADRALCTVCGHPVHRAVGETGRPWLHDGGHPDDVAPHAPTTTR